MGGVISYLFGDKDTSQRGRPTSHTSYSQSYSPSYSSYSYPSQSSTSSSLRGSQYGQTTTNQTYRSTYSSPSSSSPVQISTSRIYTAKETELIEEKVEVERAQNVFSQFYTSNYTKPRDARKQYMYTSHVQRVLESYKHENAIKFAATSFIWMSNFTDKCPVLPKSETTEIPTFMRESGIRAYYRVISEKKDGYVLVACHVNVHGFHRGDLRFVEVDDKTIVEGHENRSVIGKLYLGDVVAVTELTRLKSTPISNTNANSIKKINQESECFWAVKNMAILPRKSSGQMPFAFLENGNAVMKGFEESMTVIASGTTSRETDKLYIGTAFLPEKVEFAFTVDHPPVHKNALLAKSSIISSYPKAFGTIHTFKKSPELTEMMDIGFDAFKYSSSSSVNPDSVVETCALMGYSAANSVFNGRFDCRCFPMKNAQKQGYIVRFCIDNPKDLPTEGRWNCKNRIQFEADCGGDYRKITGVIESVLAENGQLQITARVSRDAPRHISFEDGIHIVQQREPMECTKLREGFFSEMEPKSNGRRIIETLYGGRNIEMPKGLRFEQFQFDGMDMNKYQCEYVSMILAGTPLVLGSSPFGCGKSMTIVATALEVFKRDSKKVHSQQLLITQSNYASVNLVDIAKKASGSGVKFVRFVSESNWKELPDNCRTSYDSPALMPDVFVEWATGNFDESVTRHLKYSHKANMIYFVINRRLLSRDELAGEAINVYDKLQIMKKPWQGDLLEAFFALHRPDVIMTTADSLQGLLSTEALEKTAVSTIQIDESSQVPEYTLISLLASFPNANFGLIGDIRQLPPYCEETLTGKLKDHGVGNTMERAVEKNMFPQAVLRYVYRCHPATTQLLSDLFYSGQLISGVTEQQRNQFITRRTDFWPNSRFPIIIVDNQQKAQKMGTSWSNAAEAKLVGQYVDTISKSFGGYQLQRSQIGVISFYSAQTSVLTEALRGSGVKCGTVDAFQGTERDVVILCCTNERLSDFMQLANRLNVAMSRSRQATVVIGNVDGLRKANYWSEIVRRAEENGCLVGTTKTTKNAAVGAPNAPKGKHRKNRNKKKNGLQEVQTQFGNMQIKK